MGSPSWAIPVGTLTGLAVAMFFFIWWWYVYLAPEYSYQCSPVSRFPRTWKKGTEQELKIRDEEFASRREEDIAMRREYLRQRIEAEQQVKNGGPMPELPPPAFMRQPPAYSVH